MPFDPRMMQQIGQMGVGMMGPQQVPQQGPQGNVPRPKQWWEQPPPQQGGGAPAGPTGQPNLPPGLLQMLMMGGKPTYGGTQTGGAAPSGSYGAIPGMGMMNYPR